MPRLKLDTPPPPALHEGDARVTALKAAARQPQRPEQYIEQISLLWNQAQRAFIEIGRLLIRAKETLPHGEYIASVEDQLPFSNRTAYQLREAARWALEMERQKAVPLSQLPGSYSTIYLLSTLEPPIFEAAKEEGIVRPELRRAELIAWRKSRQIPADRREQLEARRMKLRRERDRLDAELRRIEKELAGDAADDD